MPWNFWSSKTVVATAAAAPVIVPPTPRSGAASAPEAEKKFAHAGREYKAICDNIVAVKNQTVIDEIKKISKVKLIGLGATVVACATAAILFKVSIAVVAGLTLLTMATALIVLFRRHQISSKRTLNELFGEVLDAENGKITPEKHIVFQAHGQHCTRLNLIQMHYKIESSVELGTFLTEMGNSAKNEKVKKLITSTSAALKDFIVSYCQPSLHALEKAIAEANIASAKDEEAALNKISAALKEVRAYSQGDSHAQPMYSDQLVPAEDLSKIIKSCPNLEYLNLGYSIHPEVLEAARNVKHLAFSRVVRSTIEFLIDDSRAEQVTLQKEPEDSSDAKVFNDAFEKIHSDSLQYVRRKPSSRAKAPLAVAVSTGSGSSENTPSKLTITPPDFAAASATAAAVASPAAAVGSPAVPTAAAAVAAVPATGVSVVVVVPSASPLAVAKK